MKTLRQQLDDVMTEVSNQLMAKLPLPNRLSVKIDRIQSRLNDFVLESMTIAEVRELLRVLDK